MIRLKKILRVSLFLGIIATSFASCYESHYYHRNHHHSREWYGRHHTPPPAGVDFNVDIHN